MSVRVFNFNSGREMLEEIDRRDLYSPELNLYVFLYNEAGAIAYYDIDEDEAIKLALESEANNGEYWAAFLGVGGWICDDVNDRYNEPEPGASNIDFCNRYYKATWIDTKDVLKYYEVRDV